MSFAAMGDLLADPARWTTGADARNARGVAIPFDSPTACAWCLHGALHRSFPRDQWRAAGDELRGRLPDGVTLAQFNDRATHAEVLEMLDRPA